MSAFEHDYFEERHRKRRRSSFIKGFLCCLIALIAIGVYFATQFDHPTGPHIARFHIDGVIYDDGERDDILRDIRDNDDVRALILRISSPGGTTVGSEAIYEFVKEINSDIPVVAVMDEVAASGGYIAAVGARHIIARGNTITGSIGVIMEYPDVSGLMETLGVRMETIRSSALKADASPYRTLSPEGRAVQEGVIDDTHKWFRQIVGSERKLEGTALDAVATGEIFTGRMAIDVGLIDQIGSEDDAVKWLESSNSELIDLPVESWAMPEESPGWFGVASEMAGIRKKIQQFSASNSPRLLSLMK